MNKLYDKFPYKHFDGDFLLTLKDKIILCINIICFGIIFISFLCICLIKPFNDISILHYFVLVSSIIPMFINGYLLIANHWFFHTYSNQNKRFLCYSYLISFSGSFLAFLSFLFLRNPLILFVSLLVMSSSMGVMYYIIYPIYLNSKCLSLRNLLYALNNKISLKRIFVFLFISFCVLLFILSFILLSVSNFSYERSFENHKSFPQFYYILDKNTAYISSNHSKSSLLKEFRPLSKFNKRPGNRIKIINHKELRKLDQEHYFIKYYKYYPKFFWIKGGHTIYIYSKYSLVTIMDSYLKKQLNHEYLTNYHVKKLSKHEFLNKDKILSNRKYLINFRPKFNNVCYGTIFCTFVAFSMIFSFILGLSLFYCYKNNIRMFREFHYILKLFLIILEFVSITIPIIYFISNSIIRYLIVHPTYISMDYAIGILFFLPFIEILYVLFTVDAIIKIHC